MLVATLARLNRNLAIACDSTARMERPAARLRLLSARGDENARQELEKLFDDLDALVADIASRASNDTRELHARAWRELAEMEEQDAVDQDAVQEAGEAVKSAVEVWLGLLNNILSDWGDTPPLKSFKGVRETVVALQESLDTLNKDWPWKDRPWPKFDPARVAEARAAIARGEGRDLEDLIRDQEGSRRASG